MPTMISTPPQAGNPPSRATVGDFWAWTAITVSIAAGFALAVVTGLRVNRAYSEDMESLTFLAVFGIAFPVGIVAGEWLQTRDAERSRDDAGGLWPVPMAGLLFALAIARIRDSFQLSIGLGSPSILLGILIALAPVIAYILLWPPQDPRVRRVLRLVSAVVAVPSAVVVLLAFYTPTLSSPPHGVTAILAAIAIVVAVLALRRVPATRARWIDVAVGIGLALIVIYISQQPDDGSAEFYGHSSFYLGPVSSVLNGRPMLVDTFSQYGVGVMDVLALIFTVVPIGYGALTLIVGVASALLAVGMYAALRAARVELALCVVAIAVCVMVNLYEQPDPYAYFPSVGALRFGPAWAVALCCVFAARHPSASRWRWLIVAVLALASVWSFESFIYSAAAFGGAVLLVAFSAEGSWRHRAALVLRMAAMAALAITVAQIVFALATLAISGELPDWGNYFEYVRVYSVEKFGTLPILPWAVGLAIGGGYLVSLVVLARMVLHRGEAIRDDLPRFVLLAALTTFGVAAFTYYLGRSHPLNQQHISPPAILLLATWTSYLLSRPHAPALRVPRMLGGVVAVIVASMLVAWAWPGVRDRVDTSLGGQLLVGGPGLVNRDLDWMLHPPAFNPGVADAEQLIASSMPKDGTLLTIMRPYSEVELMIRTRRLNRFPISQWVQESLTPKRTDQVVRDTVADLQPGTRMLLDTDERTWVAQQQLALSLIEQRFQLREISRRGDLRVVELEPRA